MCEYNLCFCSYGDTYRQTAILADRQSGGSESEMGIVRAAKNNRAAHCRSNGYTIFCMKQLLANFPHVTRCGHLLLVA